MIVCLPSHSGGMALVMVPENGSEVTLGRRKNDIVELAVVEHQDIVVVAAL